MQHWGERGEPGERLPGWLETACGFVLGALLTIAFVLYAAAVIRGMAG